MQTPRQLRHVSARSCSGEALMATDSHLCGWWAMHCCRIYTADYIVIVCWSKLDQTRPAQSYKYRSVQAHRTRKMRSRIVFMAQSALSGSDHSKSHSQRFSSSNHGTYRRFRESYLIARSMSGQRVSTHRDLANIDRGACFEVLSV